MSICDFVYDALITLIIDIEILERLMFVIKQNQL